MQVDPEVVDILNRDNIARDSAHVVGMRPSWTHSEEEIESIRQQRAQQKQAEAMAAAAQTAGDVASKAAPMMKVLSENEDVGERLNQLLNTGV
jgi:hypothetical protein